ncbi:LAME_0D02080g1_1 [Lachancea meyersii CBS 8951]|uniref:LAME_0D02080g1_1 n=1 Tax=Lachancea meyersii CBS 8951 TaxID=1266667 RepID=A0A1G4J785_9SACH|nr:LAME_0D02080g1_1 [Lachancea meyersii CBS 8951]
MGGISDTKETVEEVSLLEEPKSSGEKKVENVVEVASESQTNMKKNEKSVDSEKTAEIRQELKEKVDDAELLESAKSAEPDSVPKGGISDLKPSEPAKSAVSDESPKISDARSPETPEYSDEERPPLPERNSSRTQVSQNPILAELTEAFPNIETKYVKAVLIASQGVLDPAFNALLYLSDPTFEAEASVPSAPAVAEGQGLARPPKVGQTQLEQDEMLARQLDAQFNKSRTRSSRHRGQENQGAQSMEDERAARENRIRRRQRDYERRTTQGQRPMNAEEQRYYDELGREASDDDFLSQFVEKDLPEIRNKVNRQVQETGKKVNEWFSGIRRTWTQEQQPQSSKYADYPEFSSGRENSTQQPQRMSSSNRSSGSEYENYIRPENRKVRFNSFGAMEGDDSVDTSQRLASHGISIYNKQDSHEGGRDDEDVAPQLPVRNKQTEVQPETTYIDTPEAATRKKWQPLPPEPINLTPSKVHATASKDKKENAAYEDDENDFLINSDDEL